MVSINFYVVLFDQNKKLLKLTHKSNYQRMSGSKKGTLSIIKLTSEEIHVSKCKKKKLRNRNH